MIAKIQTRDHPAEDALGLDAPVRFRGEAARKLMERFPARIRPDIWPMTAATSDEVLARIDHPLMRASGNSAQSMRRFGVRRLLRWLQTLPGTTWQERWQASPATSLGSEWAQAPAAWLTDQGEKLRPEALRSGLLILFVADVIRPDLEFLLATVRSRHWYKAIVTHRDPAGFAQLTAASERDLTGTTIGRIALSQIATIITAKGGGIGDITVGDCLELRQTELNSSVIGNYSRFLFYSLLKERGLFPPDAPVTLRSLNVFAGQLTPAQLVDRYKPECQPIRDLLVDYLTERQPGLDHISLRRLAQALVLHFWKNLETHCPGIDSLRLPSDVAADWKQRLRTKVTRQRLPDGTTVEVTSPRASYLDIVSYVRAFYLDISEWALQEPSRWGPWAASSPVSGKEISYKKHEARVKAKMDQRTRERLPVLPTLVCTAEQRLQEARTRLEAVRAVPAEHSFTVEGETFVKATSERKSDLNSSHRAYDQNGRRRDFALEEHRAFWGWATIEFLRHTGVRIEEMLETSHHSFTQYRLPTTGELIPLLQIAPSKADQERLLVVSPELADVLSAIISRIRGKDGTVPLIPFYDGHEKVWMSPLPLLFQWPAGGESRAVSVSTIRRSINEILQGTGLTDATGLPLRIQPHDFRRIFTTEAIANGMPPHIAQLLLGHKDINTTMGYKAVYPEEAINGHRAFIARRRTLRPSEEYRTPTDQEWDEFVGHFERRKVALGECGRAYGSSCQHEHSCVRCPVLRVDPGQKRRLEEIRDNLTARIAEAERESWLGEAENLGVSLAAAEAKLAELDQRALRAASVNLGIPSFSEVTGRTATLPLQPNRTATNLTTIT